MAYLSVLTILIVSQTVFGLPPWDPSPCNLIDYKWDRYNKSININSTYEEITFNGVEPVSNYKAVGEVRGLRYEGWYAYSFPEELSGVPIPKPYGKIALVGNNGSTITTVHPYSNVSTIKPKSAAIAIYMDTNSINTIPVTGNVTVKAYSRDHDDRAPTLISEALCEYKNTDEGRAELCVFPKEWNNVILLEFIVHGDGFIAYLSELINTALASFNLAAFLPDVIPPGTVGFLMDNLYMSYDCVHGYENAGDGTCV